MQKNKLATPRMVTKNLNLLNVKFTVVARNLQSNLIIIVKENLMFQNYDCLLIFL